MDNSFGTWIKRRRKALDLTQQELAQQIGCSPSLIFKIESDERRPSRQMAELLAERLEIPSDQRPLFLKTARQEKPSDALEGIPDVSMIDPVLLPKPSRSHLPASPTPLVGREQEIATILKQLEEPSCRLLTITGPGGIGKTRLAAEVGYAIEPHFADGIHFISLIGIGSPESIPTAIADVLELGFSGPADLIVQVSNYLKQKNTLLIFDNMEHLLDGRDLLGEILQNTRTVKILVTSREQLHLQWEWLFELQGLPLPDESADQPLESNSAVQLFIQRARQASPGFSLEADDLIAIDQICRAVGGMPLAIELAASWARMLSAPEIARELDKSLDFLEARKLDLPQRHRSIKDVFDHSWELLTGNERELLMKLSVFQGTFTREAALKVARTTLFLLSSLVDKSMLCHKQTPDRYDLHELIRSYASTQLQNNPVIEEDASQQYALYYSDWVQSLEWEFKSPRQPQTAQQIRTETCHWHCTWHWAVANQRLDLLRKMAMTLYWYFEVNGYYDEAVSAFKAAVDGLRSRGAPASLKNPEERSTFAYLLNSHGWFEFRKGNVELTVPMFKESLEVAKETEDPESMYSIHINWGYLCLFTGEIDEARRLVLQSLHYGQMLKPWHQAVSLSVLGIVAYQQEKFQDAYQQLSESLKLWRSVGDPRGLVFTMIYMGMTNIGLQRYEEARSILMESNQLARDNMDRWAHAFGLDLLGMSLMPQGQVQEALGYFEQGIKLYEEIGDQLNGALINIHLGEAYTALQLKDEAKRIYLDVYKHAKSNNWIQILLKTLISFVDLQEDMPHETRLMVALSVLGHPAITPHLRGQSETMRDAAIANLNADRINVAKELSQEKTPEYLADELLK